MADERPAISAGGDLGADARGGGDDGAIAGDLHFHVRWSDIRRRARENNAHIAMTDRIDAAPMLVILRLVGRMSGVGDITVFAPQRHQGVDLLRNDQLSFRNDHDAYHCGVIGAVGQI